MNALDEKLTLLFVELLAVISVVDEQMKEIEDLIDEHLESEGEYVVESPVILDSQYL